MTRRWGESGNVFFTLFGAVALVGVVGAATSTLMRGPVGTVVSLNQRAKADSQMQIAMKLAMLEAQNSATADCDSDTLIEPLPPGAVLPGLTNGGQLPSVGSTTNDPWGVAYGYCSWDHGAVIADPGCPAGLRAGENNTSGPVIAIISAGPDRAFGVTCHDQPSADYITRGASGADDIIVQMTYAEANEASGGLWHIKSGDPDQITTGKELDVQQGAQFSSGNVDFTGSTITGTTSFDTNAALDLSSGGLFMLPDETMLTDSECDDPSDNINSGLLRRYVGGGGEVLQICDAVTNPLIPVWTDIGGSGGAVAAAGNNTEVQFNAGGVLAASANFIWSGSVLDITGSGDFSDDMIVGDQLTVGGLADLNGNLDVAGTTNLGGTLDVSGVTDINNALNVTGNTDLGGTFNADGAATLGSTLAVTGNASFTAQALGSDGSAAQPSFTFSSSSSTGIYYTSGGMGFTIGGTNEMTLTSSGLVVDDLTVTNNISADRFLSDMATTSAALPGFQTEPGTGLYSPVDNSLALVTGGSSRLIIDGTGDVGINVATPEATLDVGGEIKVGTSSVPCAATIHGAIRYVSGDLLQVCSSMTNNWEDIGTSGGGGGGAASYWTRISVADPRLYYTDDFVGVGTNDPLTTFHVNGDFLTTGSYTGAASMAVSGAGTRMFFDPESGAFRAGRAVGTEWDNASLGNYSIAMGYDALASGQGAAAIGYGVSATQAGAFALGTTTRAFGAYSMALGLGSVVGGVAPTVTGDQSYGIFMGSQPNMDIQATNTMALIGGRMLVDQSPSIINPSVSGTLSLDVEGGVGAVQYCDEDGTNCFTAASVATGGVGAPGNNREVIFNSGGVLGTNTGFVFSSAGWLGLGTNNPLADVDVSSTGAILLPRGVTGDRPTAPVNGMIRYNSTNGRFEGYQAGAWQDIITSGAGGIAIDDLSDAITQYSSSNMYLGQGSGALTTTGNGNTSLGHNALSDVTSGYENSAIGLYALTSTDSGHRNNAFGAYALADNTTGDRNVAVGYTAMQSSIDGLDSTALGTGALRYLTTGTGNLALGAYAGDNITSGSGNIMIGYDVDAASATGSNQLNIGNLLTGELSNGLLAINGTGALTLPIGQTGDRPGAPVDGMLRYNSVSGKFEGYQAGAWQDILTSAVAGGAAAPDRGIQFNSGGNFAADANFVYSSQGSFMVSGIYTGAGAPPVEGAGTRMFFDPTKSAFRAGRVSGAQWDNANTGVYSAALGQETTASGVWAFATGYGTTASGNESTALGMQTAASGLASTAVGRSTVASGATSTAMGRSTVASGASSTAMGQNTVASGLYSTAMGNAVVAGDGVAASGFGDGSLAVGLIDDAVAITTLSQVRGIQSYGIFMGDQDGLVMTANNTMGLFGGQMVIDPRVPAQQLAARSVLDLGAATDSVVLPSGATAQRPVTPVNGMIRYNSENGRFEGYQAGAWQDILTGSALAAAPDRGIQFNSGGNFAADSNFVYTSQGTLIISGVNTGIAQTPATMTGSHMFFDPSSGALRAGSVYGGEWDNANIGNNSVAMGMSSLASGQGSVSIGFSTQASNMNAVSIGNGSVASGDTSVALGEATASGDRAFAVQGGAAAGNYAIAMGYSVVAGGDYSMGLGLGVPTSGPQTVSGTNSFGIFMGDQSSRTLSASNTMGLFGGQMVIDPRVPAQQLAARSVLDLGAATDSVVLPSGATAQRPVTPVNGMIRYNSENGRFEGYQAGAWQDILTGSALAAAPDRGIQFNSGGNFAANANFVYSSQGSFMVSGTHTGTGAPPVEGAGTRMYFDPTKSAFRAGNVTGAQWDNANTGVYSTAMGQNVTASGFYSTAIGSNNTSSGTGSVALGINSSASNAGAVALGQGAIASGLRSISLGAGATASGDYAFAAGQGAAASGADSFAVGVNGTEATAAASAAIGENVHADGINSVALGRAAGVGVGADNAMAIGLGIPGNPNYPTVVGDNSLGIFMRDQASRNLNDPNTMGLFGGRMVIDPRIQANNMSADTALEVEGTMKMAYGGEACDVAREGAIHYDSASNNFYVCKDAGVGSWDLLATGTPSAAAPDRGIQFNSGGNFAADSNFVYTSAGRMGLGTNAPLRAMDIVANSNYNPVLSLRNTSSTGLSGFEVLSDSGNFKGNIGQFHFTYDGVADPFAIATNDSDIAFVTGDTGSVAGDIHMIVKASTGRVGIGTISPQSELDVAGTGAVILARGATAQRPVTPVNGMIRYNSENGRFEGYQAGAWQDILTGSALAAAPDRGIQFNSGGNFTADADFVYTSQGSFMTSGTYTGTGAPPVSGAGTRMFFDPNMAAFRAGTVTGAQWDDVNLGSHSVALGYDVEASGWSTTAIGSAVAASGSNSSAFGFSTLASGHRSMAMGSMTATSGYYSTALGRSVVAGDYDINSGFGDGSMAIGLIDEAVTITLQSQVRGIQSMGVFMGDQDGLVMTADNTVGFFGGQMVIDPRVPAQQLAARSVLDLGAATDSVVLPSGATADRPGAPVNGMIRYNSESGKFEGYQAGTWQDIVTGAAGAAAPDRGVQFNSGGSFAASAGLTYSSVGTLGVDGGLNVASLATIDAPSSSARASFSGTNGTVNLDTWANRGPFIDVNYGSSGYVGQFYGGALTIRTMSNSVENGIYMGDGDVSSVPAAGITYYDGDTLSYGLGGLRLKTNGGSGLTTRLQIDKDGLISFTSSGAVALNSGTTAQRPASPTNGMLRYNSETGKFEGYQAGAWQDIVTGAAGGSASAPDRGIQFNSGGNFAADSNFVYTSQGALVVSGTYTGAGTEPVSGAGTRMFFDPGKSAFRAGTVSGDQWNFTSTGDYSFAAGYDTEASGESSVAMGAWAKATGGRSVAIGDSVEANNYGTVSLGAFTTATGNTSVAIGNFAQSTNDSSVSIGAATVASGMYSLAMGSGALASGDNSIAMGNSVQASGAFAMGLGLGPAPGIPSVVSGDSSLGVFMGDQNGIIFSSSNTMGLFGGRMVIDPRVPAQQLSARGVIDVGAATDAIVMPYGATSQRPSSPVNGMLRYNSETGKFEGYQAGSWQDIVTGAAGGSASAPDRGIQFNSGGSFAASSNFTYSSVGYLGLGTSNPVSELDVAGTGAVVLARGTTAQRPSSPVNGMIRYNSQNGKFEGYQAGSWQDIVTGAAVSSFVSLTDTPASYAGGAGQFVRVNSGETGLEFTDQIIPSVTGQPAPALPNLDDLGDVSAASPNDNDVIRYNSASGLWETSALGSMVSAASPDRGVQFNSGGALAADALMTYQSGALNLGTSTAGNIGVLNLYQTNAGGNAAGLRFYNNTSTLVSRIDGWDGSLDITAVGNTRDIAIVKEGTTGNSVLSNLVLSRYSTGGAGANGIGSSIESYLETTTDGTDNLGSQIETVATDAAAATFTTRMTMMPRYNNAATTGLTLLGASTGTRVGINNTTPSVGLDIATNDAAILPRGGNAQRPTSPVNGMIRYNSEGGKFEGYQAGAWADIVTGAAVSSFLGLTDTPSSYAGSAGYFVKVNPGESGLTFSSSLINTVSGVPAPTGMNLDHLDDVSAAAPNDNDVIRYNSASGQWETSSLGSLVSAASPDRGIQFNSGGNFAADGNFVYKADGDISLKGTHTATASGPGLGSYSGFYFDVQSSSIRAGQTISGVEWMDGDIGTHSTAFGRNVIAKGNYSFAQGNGATAEGESAVAIGNVAIARDNDSIAIGRFTETSGLASLALGRHVQVGDQFIAGSGDGSAGLGLFDDATVISTRPQVLGIQSLGIFMGNQDSVVFSSSNTMGLFGGNLVIDPNAPSTQLSARGVIDVGAATDAIVLPKGTTAQRPGSAVNGMLRYNSETGKFEGYQAGSWQDIVTGAAGGSASAPDRGIQFNSAGSFAASSNFTYSSAGYLGLGTSNPVSELDVAGTGAVVLARGTTAQRPSSPVNGMIRYNSQNDKFEGYQAGSWQDIVTGAATGTFVGLTDTPASYGGSAGYFVKVNAGESGLTFSSSLINNVSGQPAPVGLGLVDLDDVTISAPTAGQVLYYSSSGGGQWVNGAAASSAIDDLSDARVGYSSNSMYLGTGVGAASSASGNVGVGPMVMQSLAVGINNTAFGSYALSSVTNGSNNTAIGINTLKNATISSNNIAIGAVSQTVAKSALEDLTWGNRNVAVGSGALSTTTRRGENVAVGYEAMGYSDSTATLAFTNNTALGSYALRGSTTPASNTGTNNTAIGHSALVAVTSGGDNVALGYNAGSNLTTGSGNIVIGSGITFTSATASNQLNIGNTIYGDMANDWVGIGNSAPSVALDVTGDIEYTGTITDVSDRRLKENIHPLGNRGSMLEKLAMIDTFSFTMKGDKDRNVEFGVMAQDIRRIFPELVREDQTSPEHYLSVNYIGMIAPIVEATKELKAENDMLKAELAALKSDREQMVTALNDLTRDVQGLKAHTGYGINKASVGMGMLLGMLAAAAGSGLIIVATGIARRRRHNTGA